MSDEASLAEREPDRRLHPLGIITDFVSGLPRWIFPTLAGTAGIIGSGSWFALPLALAFAALFGIGFPFIAWSRFSYSIGPDDIRVDSGVFSRSARSIPYDRIQDVAIERGPLHRLLGLAVVRFETGAGKEEEAALDAVSVEEAERLRLLVRARKAGVEVAPGETATAIEDPEEARLLFAMTTRRLIVFGLFNFSLIFVAVLTGLVQQFDQFLPFEIWDPKAWREMEREAEWLRELGMGWQVIGVVVTLLTMLVLGFVSGIVRTFLADWNYRLERVAAGFRRRRGLLTLTDIVIPARRVQAAFVESRPIRRRFGWQALKLQTLGGADEKEGAHVAAPFAKADEIAPILSEIDLPMPPDSTGFTRVSPWPTALAFGLACLIPLIAALGNHAFATDVGLIPLAAIPVLLLLGGLRWRNHGYLAEGDMLFIRSGFVTRRVAILPFERIQSVDIARSPVMRTFGLGELTAGVAGGGGGAFTIHSIPLAEAQTLSLRLSDAAAAIDWTALAERRTQLHSE